MRTQPKSRQDVNQIGSYISAVVSLYVLSCGVIILTIVFNFSAEVLIPILSFVIRKIFMMSYFS